MSVDVPNSIPANRDLCIAKFWLRFAALTTDIAVLALIGFVLGLLFSDYFFSMGSWGMAFGFFVTLIYFTILDSGMFGVRTPGKNLLNLKVVSRDGRNLGLTKSLIRSSVLCIPYFLSQAAIEPGALRTWVAYLLQTAAFGLGISIIYLYVFNRTTRQSLQDLVVDSIVVDANFSKPKNYTEIIWYWHYLAVALILIAACVIPLILSVETSPLEKNYPSFTSLFNAVITQHIKNDLTAISLQKALSKEKDVIFVEMKEGGKWTKNGHEWERTARTLSVVIRIKDKNLYDNLKNVSVFDFVNEDRYSKFKSMANSKANPFKTIILNAYPDASKYDWITISLESGYDIGIGNSSKILLVSFSTKNREENVASFHSSSILNIF